MRDDARVEMGNEAQCRGLAAEMGQVQSLQAFRLLRLPRHELFLRLISQKLLFVAIPTLP